MSIKNLLLNFKDGEYDLYKELIYLTKHTKHTVSKEIRIAIANHVEFYKMDKLFERALKNNHTLHEEILIAIENHIENSKPAKYKRVIFGIWKKI